MSSWTMCIWSLTCSLIWMSGDIQTWWSLLSAKKLPRNYMGSNCCRERIDESRLKLVTSFPSCCFFFYFILACDCWLLKASFMSREDLLLDWEKLPLLDFFFFFHPHCKPTEMEQPSTRHEAMTGNEGQNVWGTHSVQSPLSRLKDCWGGQTERDVFFPDEGS